MPLCNDDKVLAQIISNIFESRKLAQLIKPEELDLPFMMISEEQASFLLRSGGFQKEFRKQSKERLIKEQEARIRDLEEKIKSFEVVKNSWWVAEKYWWAFCIGSGVVGYLIRSIYY